MNIQPWIVRLNKIEPIKSVTCPITDKVEKFIPIELHSIDSNETITTVIWEWKRVLTFAEIKEELDNNRFKSVNDNQIELTEFAIMGIIDTVNFKFEDEAIGE